MSTDMAADADVLVIGAGLAGLTAAVTAARQGASVRVIDARGAAGGRARTDERDGFRRNQGPRALYLGGEAIAVLGGLGIDPRGGRPTVAGVMVAADGSTAELPVGPLALARTAGLSAREKVRFGLLYRKLLGCTDTSIPVSIWLDRESVSGRLRGVIEMLIRLSTYAADTDRISAAAAARQLGLGAQGVRYVDGGWQSIISALIVSAQSNGVQLGLGDAAAHVHNTRDRDVRTELRSGESLTSRAVVFGGLSPESVAEFSGDPEVRLIADAAHPAMAACLDLCLRRLPRPEHRIALGCERPWYLSVTHPQRIWRHHREERCST
jgi:phytoene dehydrogenase-like protein